MAAVVVCGGPSESVRAFLRGAQLTESYAPWRSRKPRHSFNHTIRPSTVAPPSLPPSPAYTPGALSTHQLSTTVSSASAHAPNRLTCLRLKRWHVLLSQGRCVPKEHRPDPTPLPHHGQGRGGSEKESFSLRVNPALHPPERPSPRRADMAAVVALVGRRGNEDYITKIM